MAIATDIAPADPSREALRALALLGAFALVGTAAAYLYAVSWQPAIPRDGSTLVVGRDFLNFWMYGRAAWSDDPGRWYDVAAYQRELSSLLGANYPGQNWSYPPTVMLAAAPFGLLGYLPALGLWTLAGLMVFLSTARRQFAAALPFIAVAVSPAVVFCLISGQSSLVTAAMLLGIFALLDRRPVIAGVLIGLLTIKPQLGVLFPFFLIASARWTVFAAAAITTLALAGIAAALFGVDVWFAFVTQGLAAQNMVLSDPERIATPYYPTVFMNLRGIDLPYAAAMAVQLVFTVAAIATVCWLGHARRNADRLDVAALFLACSVAAVPYMLSYDTLALCVAAIALLARGALDTRGQWLARLVYWLPLLQVGLGTLHIPGPALIAPVFAGYVARRLRAEGRPV
ncbi:MAG: glycosyltransferase family 87 protein [Pseudolabrys sp.]